MSKLYNAISRLDEIASVEEKHPENPAIVFQQVQPKKNSAILRIAVLCAALVTAGILVVGITAWWQDWFLLRQQPATQYQPSPEGPDAIAVSSPPPPVKLEASSFNTTVNAAVTTTPLGSNPEQLLQKKPAMAKQLIPADPADPAMVMETLSFEPNQAIPSPGLSTSQNLNHRIMIGKLRVQDVITEPQPLAIEDYSQISTAEAIIEDTAQLSRWLQQAEQHRRDGDWQGAVVLYARVWQKSKNPDVANNLAASLIELDRLEEAHDILIKALAKTPNDPDLKQNLRLVQQLDRH